MVFIENAKEIASRVSSSASNEDAEKFAILVDFLISNPDSAGLARGVAKSAIGSESYIEKIFKQFIEGRSPRAPRAPSTVPDSVVGIILVNYFDADADEILVHQDWHQKSMGAENLIGDLLERYLATVLEPKGWLWCAGSVVRSIDFIQPLHDRKNTYRLLQVKNRDNSENSSSSAIRNGTDIEKWFRTFSRTGAFNWNNFPESAVRGSLSEDSFRKFVAEYIEKLKFV
jgi:hypothetical protein